MRRALPPPSLEEAPAADAHAPSPRQRRKDARPQELLDAALTLFVEKGFAATRSEEVAQRAGVSKGTLYLYYPSKEELLKAVIRHNLSALIAEGVEMVDAFTGSSADLLNKVLMTWWERFGCTPASGIHKIMIAEAQNFPDIAQFYTDEVIGPGDQLLGRIVQRGVDSGEFRPLPLKEMTIVLFAPVIFLCLHKHSLGACPVVGPDLDPSSVIHAHIDVVLRGMLVRPAKDRPTSRRATIGDTAGPSPAKPRTRR